MKNKRRIRTQDAVIQGRVTMWWKYSIDNRSQPRI